MGAILFVSVMVVAVTVERYTQPPPTGCSLSSLIKPTDLLCRTYHPTVLKQLSQKYFEQHQCTQHSMEIDPRYVTVAPPEHIDKSRVDNVLDKDHQKAFAAALSNILRTKVAETTLAQIADGLPLEHVAFSLRGHRYTGDDPVATHTELCPGALEKTRAFREGFDPALMMVRTDVCHLIQLSHAAPVSEP